MIARRLQAVTRIRPGEGRTASLLLALMLVGMTGAAVGANGVESLFFSRFGPGFLPYLYLVLGPLTFAVTMGMGTMASGAGLGFLVRLPLAVATTLLVARAILGLQLHWFYPAMWLVMMVLWTTQVLGFWGLAGAVSDTRQAKRLFPLYGAAVIAGWVLGGISTGPLADRIQAENLVVVWAGTMVAAFLFARSIAAGAARVRRRRRRMHVRPMRRVVQGFRDLWDWPLLRWMSVSLVVFAVLYFSLSLLFAEAATARYPRTDELAGFLGLFMGASSGAAMLVSLLVANRLFARFGVPAMVVVLPAIYLAGYVMLAVGATFGVLVGFRFLQMVWVNGVWASGWQALFNVVPAERRARIRLSMDGGPFQVGIVLAGGLLILADRVLDRQALYVVAAGAAAVGLWSMWRARRAYAGTLVEALRSGNPDVFRPEQEPFGGFRTDADARAAMLAGASDPDPAVRLVSTELLADLADRDSAEALVPVLADPVAEVRAAAVLGVARADGARCVDALRPLVADPDPRVRARAAAALLPEPGARCVLVEMGRDPRPDRRAAALDALGRVRQGLQQVAAGLHDPEPSVRRVAVETLASFDPDASVSLLVAALADRYDSIRWVAAQGLSCIGERAQPALIRALARADLETGAVLALSAIPGPPPPELLTYAQDRVDLATRYHRLWLGVNAGRDDRLDLLARAVRHRAVQHAVNALRAVTRLGEPQAMAVAIENLSSGDPQQRANALETLEAAGEPRVVRPLLALWDSEPTTAGDEEAAVGELLQDEDTWVRACAALAAGAIEGARPATVVVELARSDPEAAVRDAAAATLQGGRVETLSTLSLVERILFLSRVSLFAGLAPEDLKHVAEVASEHTYDDGEIIAEQGETGDDMHIVVSGEIRVVIGDVGGAAREMARRKRGEYVGEMAIISEESRMASLVCAGPVRTLSLDRRSFKRILQERPDVSLGVMRVLSDRLRQAHAPGAPGDTRG